MAYPQRVILTFYKRLISLYPRGFREQFGESMQQTFKDLYQEHRVEGGYFYFILWTFFETTIGIIKEYNLLFQQEVAMKNIILNPKSAALTSSILSLPLGVTYLIFATDMELLIKPYRALFTVNGYDVNMLGRIVLIGGLLLLPIAFVINLLPILKKDGLEQKRILRPINLIVGIVILLLIIMTWGGLVFESMYCLQGIRCD